MAIETTGLVDRNMEDILKDAELIDPSNIIVEDDEDDEYLYDLKKKKQKPRSSLLSTTRALKYISRNKQFLWILVGFFIVVKIYDFAVYTTYPYYSGNYRDHNNYNLVSITTEVIQLNYHEAITKQGSPVDWNKYAYVSYATDLNYLCASLMLFKKLKNDYKTKADLVLFYNLDHMDHDIRSDFVAFEDNYQTIADSLGVKLINMDAIHVGRVEDTNFESSFNKLALFQFAQYPQLAKYSKLVYMDSDIYLNDKLDELFFLPNEFDVAMPLAYWIVDPAKNYQNLLSNYPSTEPNFAPSERKHLNYFRIQDGGYNLKWSTALMVVTPSAKLADAINEGLSIRSNTDYDMDIVNSVFDSVSHLRRLTLPHRGYFMITGDIFLSPHGRNLHLADPLDLQFINNYSLKKCSSWTSSDESKPYWCHTDTIKHDYLKRLNETKIVHFSDFPLPKPWVQSTIKIACGNKKKKDLRRTLMVENCDDYNVWAYYHNLFIRERLGICHLHQEEDDD